MEDGNHIQFIHTWDNKNGNLEAARQNLGINIQPPRSIINIIENDTIDELQSEDFESDKSSYHDKSGDIDTDSFPLVLTPSEWEQINPDQTSSYQHKKRLKSKGFGQM